MASAFFGSPSTWGSGILTKVMEETRCGGIFGRGAMFLGVDMKGTL